MRSRSEAAPTANVLPRPVAIHQPECQAVPLALGLGNTVAIGMDSNASVQKQISLKFINLDNSSRSSDQFLELYNHAPHRGLLPSASAGNRGGLGRMGGRR